VPSTAVMTRSLKAELHATRMWRRTERASPERSLQPGSAGGRTRRASAVPELARGHRRTDLRAEPATYGPVQPSSPVPFATTDRRQLASAASPTGKLSTRPHAVMTFDPIPRVKGQSPKQRGRTEQAITSFTETMNCPRGRSSTRPRGPAPEHHAALPPEGHRKCG
jgi:hypothetical protein